MKDYKGERSKYIGLDDLKQFFDEYGWHFTEEDIEDFLWETRWITEDNSLAKISEVSGMIRTNTDFYPY